MQKMKERKGLITKSFQVTGITSTDPGVVRSDDVLKRAMEAVQRELSHAEENEDKNDDDLNEDPFADIELEEYVTSGTLRLLIFIPFKFDIIFKHHGPSSIFTPFCSFISINI
jgi:hypothetical protein